MSKPTLSPVAQRPLVNYLLDVLPAEEKAAISPHLEEMELPQRLGFYEPDRPIEHVYFVHHGVASLMAPMKDGLPVEIATVGPEGMVGLPVFLSADRVAHRSFMQVSGQGARIAAPAFRQIIERCPTLHERLLRYTLGLLNQVGQNAACNRAHSIEERCCRWLLMTHDRVQARSFELTQEFLAQMLGVRRPSVSIAAGMLAKAGFITYVRGQMTILDRDGMEAAACECYRIIADEFTRLLG
jgi:CRP-like cAMP-binding protein